jgi:hypoxanthine phosphoribosyltransferase
MNDKIVFSENELKILVRKLADKINNDYKKCSKLILIGILKGCFVFLSDLIKKLDINVVIDFVSVESYGDSTESSGEIKILKSNTVNIKNENVLIVDDLIDSGLTLKTVYDLLKDQNPQSLKTCVLLDKPARRTVNFEPDYVSEKIDDIFIIGYGMDYMQKYRQFPYITKINKNEIE